MPSRAESPAVRASSSVSSTEGTLRAVGAVLNLGAFVCLALILWRMLVPVAAEGVSATVGVNGALETPVATLLRATAETLDVALTGVPDAKTRAALRALRGSGHALRVTSARALPATAVAVENEWRTLGGARVLAVGGDVRSAALSDGAGLIDSVPVTTAGLRSRSGPVQGAFIATVPGSRAAVAALHATVPREARVLVLGEASWESRFVIAALEEAGWPVDVGVTLSPKVTITQGDTRSPSRSRHAVVIVLPGAPAAAVTALPAFVRAGGGLIIVGEAARIASLASLRAGAPGTTVTGEAGAEASSSPQHGLDLTPIGALTAGTVTLEDRDGRTSVAARRVGAGRVVQVGYENSWLWRMAGNDDAPVAHRRWWTSLVASVVSLRAPAPDFQLDAEHDTLDAAPLAALARDVGLPTIRTGSVTSASHSWIASLDLRWLLAFALVLFLASWTLRRWRGLV